ncbi:MAG: SpoIIE family protein phosphatase [Bacteroidetes bacterium]|nr:SpoIIE family protein phosphatase [Bacteroidota bacterium]
MPHLPVRLLLMIGFLLSVISASGNRYNFRTFSVAEGLAQSRVTAITQDVNGYIWAGTNGGLSRFNGKTFRNYFLEDGLPSNRITSLCSSPGYLWIGTPQGISVWNGLRFESIGQKTGLHKNTIKQLLWNNGLIYAITPGEIYTIRENVPGGSFAVDSLNSRNFSIMPQFSTGIIDNDGNLWVACTDEGLYGLIWNKSRVSQTSRAPWITTTGKFAGRTTEVMLLNKDTVQFGMNITSLTLDQQGNIWFCDLAEGVGRILLPAGKNMKVQSTLVTASGTDLFPKRRYRAILCDSRGTIWTGTDGGGVIRLLPSDTKGNYTISETQLREFTYNTGLKSDHIVCLYEDDERNLWIGTLNEGMASLNGEKFITHIPSNRFDGDNTLCVFKDSFGNIWSGEYGGGLNWHVNNDSMINYLWEKGICESIITSITEDKYHGIWCATVGGGISILPYANRNKTENAFVCLNSENGLPWDFVSVVFTDISGKIWAGMQTGGVSLITTSGPEGPFSIYQIGEEEEVLNSGRINAIFQDAKGDIWIATSKGLAQLNEDGKVKNITPATANLLYGDIACIAQDMFGNIWLGTNNNGIWITKSAKQVKYTFSGTADKDEFISTQSNGLSNNIITGFLVNRDVVWVTTRLGLNKIVLNSSGSIASVRSYTQESGLNTVEINNNAIIRDRHGDIWLGSVTGLTRFILDNDINTYPAPHLNIEQILLNYKNIHTYINNNKSAYFRFDSLQSWFALPANLRLPYSMNHISFVYSGIQLAAPERVYYQYKLVGFDDEWSPPTRETRAVYSGLEPGEYTFMVKASNADGKWMSDARTYRFSVLAPFYRTWWFYLMCAVLVAGSIFAIFWLRERNQRQTREKLERTVQERTAETLKQKEELEKQAVLIQAKNRDITSSIEYAQRIQQAILPETNQINAFFSDHFIIYQPRDIVSGDFYWMAEKDEMIYIAAVDCTGHGVPGAFMSLISYNLLNEALIVSSTRISDVLENLRLSLYSQLKKYDEESIIYDGLDISLISFDPRTRLLSITNSNRPSFIISGDVLTHVKSCKTTIGGVQYSTNEKFDTVQVLGKPGDKIYLFTDGYTDQFGGPKNKRFGRASFERMLLEISDLPMPEQRNIIIRRYNEWRGVNEQMDDMLVIGLEI